ncbi:MAG: hypothetical protein AABW92_03670 [Nanoarchaeota archaeon]
MGIFDNINPFKKRDELALPPLDGGLNNDPLSRSPGIDQNFDTPDPNFDTPSFSDINSEPQPMDDPRMRMPLGDNIRQGRMEAMHGDSGYNEIRENRPNPLQKDLDLISSKLDYLKAGIEAVNQRLANLENLTRQEQEKKKW